MDANRVDWISLEAAMLRSFEYLVAYLILEARNGFVKLI